MKAKYVLGLLTALILTVAPALAQEAAPAPPEPPEDFNTFSLFVEGGGFLGVYGEDINNENMARYRLSQARGVGITRIVADSPAEKAGLRKDDVILRIDDENVTSVRKLNRLVSEIAPDHSVKITISRNGAEQELTATMGKRKNASRVSEMWTPEMRSWGRQLDTDKLNRQFGDKLNREFADKFNREFGEKFKGFQLDNNSDLTFFFANHRRIGINGVELTPQLAAYFGVTSGKGVLITAVSDDGPAAKAGLKAGDVITAVDGEPISSPDELSELVRRKKDGDVTLTVIRNKSQQTFRVTPVEGRTRTTGRPAVGRQIVIPRIEFPDIVIPMPRIEIPTVPAVNINMPQIRINPGIRISRGVYGPI
jgi:membrane-associated protease RseP (regulator of RpoE activity)